LQPNQQEEIMRRILGLFCLVVFVSLPVAGQVQCGGTERWRPKVGTDPEVGQVTINQPVPIDLHDLIQLPEPTRPNDNINRIVPDETNVYTVRAFMLQFKLEQNDSDYHLVITDDTHQFTDHQGNNTGHSLVAEIPDPGCLEGKNHNFPGSTPFANAIMAARALMDARFPNALRDGTFNPVNLPVEITAVGFFDRPHGQIGRAQNNIELHPILRLCFLDGPIPQCSTAGPSGSGGPTPPPGAVVQMVSAPFVWTLVSHGSGAAPIATLEVTLQGTGKLQLNFFSAGATLPADSFDSASKIAVQNLDASTLSGIMSALGSAGTLTVTTSSTGQPPQVRHDVQFASKTP
jgi:hypothetical protein